MKQIKLGGVLDVPALAVGCMRITSLDEKGAQAFVSAAMEEELNFFDHADIYGGGECETVFAKAVSALKIPRDKLFLQSKCGIVPGKMYDFSKEHILSSVDGILKRLDTDYLDVLLLHRPDALMEPEEVAEAFDLLESQGKVRYFGVSNMRPDQIRLLKKCVRQKIVANQLQFSPMHAEMVSVGLEVNMVTDGAVDRDGGILNYCRHLGIEKDISAGWTSMILILLSVLLTGFNIYPQIAKWGGAGALVPITGFANGVCSSAVEFQKEGQVFGIGCQIFKIAGPVILYGIFSSWVLGLIYWILGMLRIV